MFRMTPVLACALVCVGCSAMQDLASKDGIFTEDATDTALSEPSAGRGGADDNDAVGGGDLPPEREESRLALMPAQTPTYIFIAAPERDSVTRVKVDTLAVDTIRVGKTPMVVRTTPDHKTAVVFNSGDNTVTLLDTDSLAKRTVAVRRNMNALVLSPDGAWAVLWHDANAEAAGGPASGALSYNEISLVHVAAGTHKPLVVGFEPKSVQFTPDGAMAVMISDASLAAIDLTQASPTPSFLPIADPLDPPVAAEVVLTPDGTLALVRQDGLDKISVVGLQTGDIDAFDVPAGPTDLDLTPDGQAVVVVSRAARKVSVFDIADLYGTPRTVEIPNATPFGSVDIGEDGYALLFTTAAKIGRFATWRVDSDEVDLHALPKPVSALARTPDGERLLVVHSEADSEDGSTPAPYRKKPAISLVSLEDGRTNTLALTAPVKAFTNSADGSLGYAIMEDKPFLEILRYDDLLFDEKVLPSAPVFLGVLPDVNPADAREPAAWVSQVHSLGRLSFYDPNDGSLKTLTGFELNGHIGE